MAKRMPTRQRPKVGDTVRVFDEALDAELVGTIEDLLSCQFTYRVHDTDKIHFCFYADYRWTTLAPADVI